MEQREKLKESGSTHTSEARGWRILCQPIPLSEEKGIRDLDKTKTKSRAKRDDWGILFNVREFYKIMIARGGRLIKISWTFRFARGDRFIKTSSASRFARYRILILIPSASRFACRLTTILIASRFARSDRLIKNSWAYRLARGDRLTKNSSLLICDLPTFLEKLKSRASFWYIISLISKFDHSY